MNEVIKAIKERRSIRKFKKEKPDKEEEEEEKTKANVRPLLFSRKKESDELVAKLTALADKPKGHSVDDVLERLETIKNFM